MTESIVGVLLAGGLARRFGGGDKCLLELGARPLLDHVIARVSPQVDRLILNVNGDSARFSAYGLDVVEDVVEGFAGPLAGVLSALEWTQVHVPTARWVVSFPTDAPFLPKDLVARMLDAVAAEGADLACPVSMERTHPVFGLWPVGIAADLRHALVNEDIRKIDRFTGRYKISHVEFSADPFDPFLNINTPEDLQRAAELLERQA